MVEDLIEKYLNNELSEAERVDFEKKLLSDEKLAVEVRSYRLAKSAIEAASQRKLKEELNALGEEMWDENAFKTPSDTTPEESGITSIHTRIDTPAKKEKSEKRLPVFKYVTRIAAAFVLLIGAYIIFDQFNPGSPKNLAALYEAHFERLKATSVLDRGIAGQNANWEKAINYYEQGNFAQAIPLMEEVLQDADFQYRSAVHLFLGICFLAEDEPILALKNLERVQQESSYYQQAQWYTGLAYLKLNEKEKAQEVFNQITHMERHFKKEEASEIYDELDKIKE